MNYNIFSELLQGTGLICINYQIDDNKLYLYCTSNSKPKCCESCGSVSFIKHSKYTRKIKFLKILDYPSFILFEQSRYICKDCKNTFNEQVTFVTKNSTVATVVKVKLIADNSRNISFKDIAKENNVSVGFTFNHFKEHSSESRNKLTSILLFDEIDYGNKNFAFVILDGINGKIIDILPRRTHDILYNYFSEIPIEERLKVKYICTDLYSPYKDILPNFFHKATAVADRFHYVRLVTKAFDRTRINVMKQYIKSASDIKNKDREDDLLYSKILKKYNKMLLINKYNAKHDLDYVFTPNYLKKEMSKQELIEYMVNFDEDIYDAYKILTEFYRIISISTFDNILDNLNYWYKLINESERNMYYFKSVIGTFKSWSKQIQNSFIKTEETGKNVSNGKIEGKNSNIRRVLSNSAGIKDFETFRKKLLSIDNKNRSFKN